MSFRVSLGIVGPIDSDEARYNLWSMRNDIENFQYGLEHNLHKVEGWLWHRLVEEGVVSDTQENLREKMLSGVPGTKDIHHGPEANNASRMEPY